MNKTPFASAFTFVAVADRNGKYYDANAVVNIIYGHCEKNRSQGRNTKT